MNITADKKPSSNLEKKQNTSDSSARHDDFALSSSPTSPKRTAAEELREAIRVLDAERSEMVKNAIEGIKPGRPFDSSVVREINKIETRKNRLIVARFASLLKKNGSDVQAIVHQIIEL